MGGMDERARTGGDVSPEEDDEFTVSQDTEFDEAEPAETDEERPIDDGAVDDVPGIDAERRVDLAEEPTAAPPTAD
jgi:hypothetical protein